MASLSAPSQDVWQWWDDYTWVDYDQRISTMIDQKIQDGTMVVTFSFGNSNYEINLFTLEQKNLATDFSRRIRCSVIATVEIKWQWDNNGTWTDYDDAINVEINNNSPNNTDADINGQSYQINPGNMIQINTASNDAIAIRQQIVVPVTATPQDLQPVDMTCGICYERNKDTVFVPCGHMFCRTCAARLSGKDAPCPFCRARIHKKLHVTL